MRRPVRDPRAGHLLRRYDERFHAPDLPVPVESIAEDHMGVAVAESEDLPGRGMLLPAEREIWLNATESLARCRFTLPHEVGYWVCQCLEGRSALPCCRGDRSVRGLPAHCAAASPPSFPPQTVIGKARGNPRRSDGRLASHLTKP